MSNRVAANRANAVKSTGPRSGPGRQLSVQNAKKHGLSLSVLHDAELAPEVEMLSRQIAGGKEALLPIARDIAEAQVDLSRVRRLRGELIDRALRNPQFQTAKQSSQFRKLLERLLQIEGGRGRFGPADTLRAQLLCEWTGTSGARCLAANSQSDASTWPMREPLFIVFELDLLQVRGKTEPERIYGAVTSDALNE